MGRKAKKMDLEQAQLACTVSSGVLELFESISGLIDAGYSKSSYIPQKYTNVLRAIQGFVDLMELEVERASS